MRLIEKLLHGLLPLFLRRSQVSPDGAGGNIREEVFALCPNGVTCRFVTHQVGNETVRRGSSDMIWQGF